MTSIHSEPSCQKSCVAEVGWLTNKWGKDKEGCLSLEGGDGLNPNNRSTLYQQTLLPEDVGLFNIGGAEFGSFYVKDDGSGAPHNYIEGLKDVGWACLAGSRRMAR